MKTLFRCAGSSLVAVSLEFGLLSLLVSVLHWFYLAASLIAGVAGFVISFLFNRIWAFEARTGSAPGQLLRHAFVVVGGLGLGLGLLWLEVDQLGLPYQLSWIIGGSLVFLAWTYPMHRWFTYRAYRPLPEVIHA
jgi:putative flippase GtrA